MTICGVVVIMDQLMFLFVDFYVHGFFFGSFL